MKNLPLGIQSFPEIINNQWLYVDKTRDIYSLLQKGKYYFLARPRRFGKSLLISTLKEIFKGNQEAFKGLWIEDKMDWESYPVIHIDFSKIGVKELGIEEALLRALRRVAQEKSLSVVSEKPGVLLEEIINKLGHSKQVVLLIDEYDKPIIDYLEDIEKADRQRDLLKNFYAVLKGSDAYLRFVFLTGVSKFSKVSIFSDLNNLTDISTSEEFANIVGYSQSELEHYFADRIPAMAEKFQMSQESLLSKIKHYYNGYSWNGKDFLYNPFSILSFFRLKSFDNFWFSTGTPTFLTKLLQKDFKYDLSKMKGDQISLDNLNLRNPQLSGLLFQTGYLTIKSRDEYGIYHLDYPNAEVEESLVKFLLSEYIYEYGGESTILILDIREALQENDFEGLKEAFNVLFASIPMDYFLENREKFYHAIIFLTLKLLGYYAQVEMHAGRGRLDALVFFKDKIYVIEFKRDQSAQEAMAQIHQKGYYKAYQGEGKPIYLLGINMDSEKKEVEDILVEEL